jgi:hypothetical protein
MKTWTKIILALFTTLVVVFIGIKFAFNKKIDIQNKEAVASDLQGTWIAHRYAMLWIHYKIEFIGNNYKCWHKVTRTEDYHYWEDKPDATGTYELSYVKTYPSNINYRSIMMDQQSGLNDMFYNSTFYEEGSGLVTGENDFKEVFKKTNASK